MDYWISSTRPSNIPFNALSAWTLCPSLFPHPAFQNTWADSFSPFAKMLESALKRQTPPQVALFTEAVVLWKPWASVTAMNWPAQHVRGEGTEVQSRTHIFRTITNSCMSNQSTIFFSYFRGLCSEPEMCSMWLMRLEKQAADPSDISSPENKRICQSIQHRSLFKAKTESLMKIKRKLPQTRFIHFFFPSADGWFHIPASRIKKKKRIICRS